MSNHDSLQFKPMKFIINCANQSMEEKPTFVLLGSSTTQFSFQKGGWGQLLINHYHVKADILNRGFSGYNTRMILPLVDSIFAKMNNVRLVTIWLGSNDSSISFQRVPVEEFKQNLLKIIDKIKNLHPKCKILLITPQVFLLLLLFYSLLSAWMRLHFKKPANENGK